MCNTLEIVFEIEDRLKRAIKRKHLLNLKPAGKMKKSKKYYCILFRAIKSNFRICFRANTSRLSQFLLNYSTTNIFNFIINTFKLCFEAFKRISWGVEN